MKLSVTPLKRLDPPLPPAITLEDPAWQNCIAHQTPMLCLSKQEAQKLLRNQIATGKWMSAMKNVVAFYRSPPKDVAK